MKFYKVQQLIFGLLMTFFFCCDFHSRGSAQNIRLGTPPIRNFTKKTYSASPQNWHITQRRDGLMLFANNLGLLTFDGNAWQVRPMANHTIMRSIKVHDNGRIYVGGQGEFGYFDQTSGRELKYVDLSQLVKGESKNFSDVWNILIRKEGVYFQTFRQVMFYDGSKVKVFEFSKSIQKMFLLDDQIHIQLDKNSYATLSNGRFIETTLFKGLKGDVVDICKLGDGRTLISTYKGGIYSYINGQCIEIKSSDPRLNNIWITAMKVLSDGNILIGTSNKGLLIVNPEFNTLLSFSKENGILNSTILAATQDRNGDIWAASEFGIDFIEYKSPYRILYPDVPFNGTGYSAAMYDNHLYLGTNNGLYRTDLKSGQTGISNPFSEIKGSKDICWNMDVIDGKLWLGHNEGASVVENNGLNPVFRGQGVWKFLKQGDGNLAFGAYEGMGIIKKGSVGYSAKMSDGFIESCRILVKDKNENIWMSHPYRGIYRISFDQSGNKTIPKLYGADSGLETNLDNYIIMAGDNLYASNTNGVFIYNKSNDKFKHDTVLEKIIGFEKGTKLLLADQYHNIWYRKGSKIGFLEPKEVDWKKVYERHLLPSLPESLAGGFEKVFPLSENEFIFNCESGFLLFDKKRLSGQSQFKTSISKVILLGKTDTTLINGVESSSLDVNKKNPLTINHFENNLRIEVASFSYNDELIEYRYQLGGLDKSDASWTAEPFVSYNNLGAGKYHLKIETRIGGIVQKEITSFYFEIQPAWYNSFLFRASMLAIFAFGIITVFLIQNRKFETEKTQLTQRHQAEVDEQASLVAQSEEEIMKLKNDQLQKDINFKNTELASIAMHLAHKKDFITTLELELKNIHKDKLGPVEVASNLKRIIHRLQQETILDDDWERFTHYFDELHMSFINRLKLNYPDLTTNDHRLCAYLRMNLSTKEIAALSNISTRGVEGSRYRLRKKMDLDNEVNLNEFMNKI